MIQKLTRDWESRDALGVALVGSFTRGEEDSYSDLDVHVLVAVAPHEPRSLCYLEGRLISTVCETLTRKERCFSDPRSALWNLSALQNARILSDPHGHFLRLQQRALDFVWADLAEKASFQVSEHLHLRVELLHKLMGGLEQQQPEKLHLAALAMSWNMAEACALGHGVLIPSENRFWSTVCAAEPDPNWRTDLMATLGLQGETPQVRGHAALRLYQRSVELFRHHLQPEHQPVVQEALQQLKHFLERQS